MTAPSNEHHAAGQADTSADRTRYPENHVVAVLDTNAQVTNAIAALTSGGFMDSEIQYGTGVTSRRRARREHRAHRPRRASDSTRGAHRSRQ